MAAVELNLTDEQLQAWLSGERGLAAMLQPVLNRVVRPRLRVSALPGAPGLDRPEIPTVASPQPGDTPHSAQIRENPLLFP